MISWIFIACYAVYKFISLGVVAFVQHLDRLWGGGPGSTYNILCRIPLLGIIFRKFPKLAQFVLYNRLVTKSRLKLHHFFARFHPHLKVGDAEGVDGRCAECLTKVHAEGHRAISISSTNENEGENATAECAGVLVQSPPAAQPSSAQEEVAAIRKRQFGVSTRGEDFLRGLYMRYLEDVHCSMCNGLASPEEKAKYKTEPGPMVDEVVREALERRDRQLQAIAAHHRQQRLEKDVV